MRHHRFRALTVCAMSLGPVVPFAGAAAVTINSTSFSGNYNFYGPSSLPGQNLVAIGSMGPVNPDSFSYSFSGADYSVSALGSSTVTVVGNVTTIDGSIKLTSTITNTTAVLAKIDAGASFGVYYTLNVPATYTLSYSTPGDPPLTAPVAYQGYTTPTIGAAQVPAQNASGSLSPNSYLAWVSVSDSFEIGAGDWAPQTAEMDFHLVLTTDVPGPGAGGIIGIGGVLGLRRRR